MVEVGACNINRLFSNFLIHYFLLLCSSILLDTCLLFAKHTHTHTTSINREIEIEMGNCQAIDNASLVIQQPCGRVDKAYWAVPASYVMKTNPGYHVALLLTTTLHQPSSATHSAPLRITRIKLLRPTDTLLLGHTYRLVSSQEVMKGVWAKKYAKLQKKKQSEAAAAASGKKVINSSSDFDTINAATNNRTKLAIKHDRQRTKTSSTSNSATARPRGWHPSLHSITEAAS